MKKFCAAAICLLALASASVSYGASVGYVSTRPADAVDTTAKEDLFRVKGTSDDFILLDHDENGFFVTSKKYYGTHVYDPDSDCKYDIEKENNMAYWLSKEFLEEGNKSGDNTYTLPNVIKEHLVEHDWECEAGYVASDFNEDYVVRAKLALMSVTEWKKYHSLIGLRDDTSSNYYFLRSVCGTDANSPIQVVNTLGGTTGYGKAFNAYGVRPVFYLDDNFFIDEKLDMTATGANVLKRIRDTYSKEQLLKCYSQSEVNSFYKIFPPQAKNVKLHGLAQVGQILKSEYKYVSPDNKKEGATDIRWLRSRTKEGTYSLIYGASESEYCIRPEDTGYYICCEIVPKSENQIGNAVRSAPTASSVKAANSPYAEDVYIDGKAVVGERLIARYSYYDNDDDREDGTVIKWQASDDGENFEDIPGADGINYVVGEEYAGKYLRIFVEVRNKGYNGVGAAVVSEKIGRVGVYPKREQPKILRNGDVISLGTQTGENDVVCWEINKDGSGFAIAKMGASYKLTGIEKAVRAFVIPIENGVAGKAVRSDIIEINGAGDDKFHAVKEAAVNGSEKIAITAAGSDLAYSIFLKLSFDGVRIEDASSKNYKIIERIADGKAEYILTGTGLGGAGVSGRIMELTVGGNGKITLEETRGVYKNDGGEYASSELDLSIEK